MAKEISHIYNVGDVVGNLEITQQLRLPRQMGKGFRCIKLMVTSV